MFLIFLKFQLQIVLNMFLLQKLNTSLMEYKNVFIDDTIDFISINDLVDNVEIVLME